MSTSPLRNPRLQVMLVVGLLTVSSFYVWTITRYRPRLESIEQLVAHETRLQQANQQTRRAIAALGLDRIRSTLEAYDKQAEHVGRLVPPDGEDLKILPAIAQHADALGIRLEEITPLEPSRQGPFVVYRFRIRALGGYHDIGAFITELLMLPRITQIRDAQIRATTIESRNGQSVRGVRASFDLLAFATASRPAVDSATTTPGGAQ